MTFPKRTIGRTHHAPDRRAWTDEPFRLDLVDGLYRDAHADAKDFGKVAHGRQYVARTVIARLDGRTQPCDNLFCQIAPLRTVKREQRFLENPFLHGGLNYITSRTSCQWAFDHRPFLSQ